MTILRRALLIGVPLAFSVLLWFHPMIGDYEGLRDVTTRFQVVHVGMVLAFRCSRSGCTCCSTGSADGRPPSRASPWSRSSPSTCPTSPSRASRSACSARSSTASGRPARRDRARLVQDFARNPILGEPGIFWALGSTAWTVVIVATVLALRRAGAGRRCRCCSACRC